MIELDQIDRKAAATLSGYLVRKDLVRTFSRQFPVPTYVVEFLLGRYCASIDEEEIQERIGDLKDLIRRLEVLVPEEQSKCEMKGELEAVIEEIRFLHFPLIFPRSTSLKANFSKKPSLKEIQ